MIISWTLRVALNVFVSCISSADVRLVIKTSNIFMHSFIHFQTYEAVEHFYHMAWFMSPDLTISDSRYVPYQLPTSLWITAIVCACIGTVLHVALIYIRRLRAVYPLNVFIILIVVILWIVVAVIHCYQIKWKYNLLMLFLTAVIGVLPLFIGLRSKRLTDEGYFLFYLLSMALIIIGIMFYYFSRSKDFPFNVLSAIFLSTGIAVIIFYSMVWLKYSQDKFINSTVFKIYIIWLELLALFLTFS
ncbi:unnamed protein product, partial [Trichobilharzia szidati]